MEQDLRCTGKKTQFEQILLQYTPMIYKIMQQLHIAYDTEDFFAEGRLALYEAFLNFDDEKGDFSAYAFSWIRGRLLKKIGKERRMAQTGTLELCQDIGHYPTESRETSLFIQQVFQSLSTTEKRIFQLVFLCDQPISAAVKDPSVNLTYRQGKYLVQGIRRKFQKEWRDARNQ